MDLHPNVCGRGSVRIFPRWVRLMRPITFRLFSLVSSFLPTFHDVPCISSNLAHTHSKSRASIPSFSAWVWAQCSKPVSKVDCVVQSTPLPKFWSNRIPSLQASRRSHAVPYSTAVRTGRKRQRFQSTKYIEPLQRFIRLTVICKLTI